MRKQIEQKQVEFLNFTLVSNGTIFNKDYFELLKYIKKLSLVTDCYMAVAFSHDYWHNKSCKELGIIDRKTVSEKIKEVKKLYPEILFEYRKYTPKDEGVIVNFGRAKKLKEKYSFIHTADPTLLNETSSGFTNLLSVDVNGNIIPN